MAKEGFPISEYLFEAFKGYDKKILKFNNFNVSTLVVPNYVVRFLSFFVPSLRAIAKRLNKTEYTETKNAKSILGFYPNSVDSEIIESAQQIHLKNK